MNFCQGYDILFWFLSIFSLALVIFGLYPDFRGSGNPLNKVEHILYQATCRIIWAAGLGYIIFSCISYGGKLHKIKLLIEIIKFVYFHLTLKGIFNKIFSCSIWIPLSRLSFSTYLIHYSVIYAYYATQEYPLQPQDSYMVLFIKFYSTLNKKKILIFFKAYVFISHLIVSNVFGYFVSIVFEIPLLGLEKFIFKKQ